MGNCIIVATNLLEHKNVKSLKYVFSLLFTAVILSFSTFSCQLTIFLADLPLLAELKSKVQTVSRE